MPAPAWTAPGTPTCAGLPATIVGTAGNDVLRGTPGRDVIAALAGHDTVHGGGGDDVICGGPGNDRLRGGAGDDVLRLGPPGAPAFPSGHRESARGGAGDDVLVGSPDADLLHGGLGDDLLRGRAGSDELAGGQGADRLFAGTTSLAWTGSSRLCAPAPQKLTGGPGDDVLRATPLTPEACGRGTILHPTDPWVSAIALYAEAAGPVHVDLSMGGATGEGSDTLSGVTGVVGSVHDDVLTGDASPNLLWGGAGNDTLDGGAGDDAIQGHAGDDLLIDLGESLDWLQGHGGDDEFRIRVSVRPGTDVFELVDGGKGTDSVTHVESDLLRPTMVCVSIESNVRPEVCRPGPMSAPGRGGIRRISR